MVNKMIDNRPKILLTLTVGGENGGPYTSHRRIIESELSEKYHLSPLMIPKANQLRKPKIFFSIIKKIKVEHPDLVQITGLQLEGFFMMLACRVAKVKTLVVVHGSSMDAIGIAGWKKIVLKKLERYTIKHATKIYGVSDFVSSWERLKNAKNYFGTIYNLPEKNNESKTSISNLRDKLGFSKDDIIVVSTGRITKDKGYDIFWDAIQKIGKAKKIKYVIAGDGDYKGEWEKEIFEKDYQDQVFLLGFRQDIDNILSVADIFMICSKHETLCISVLEAAMHSLPIIATNTGGIPEIVGKEDGILVENGDIAGFSKAIQTLVNNPDLRKRMGNQLHQKVLKKFDRKNILRRLNTVYYESINLSR